MEVTAGTIVTYSRYFVLQFVLFRGSVVRARNNLILSLAAIAFIIALAVIQLALQGNWPKVLRVSVAFLAYSTLLLYLARWTARASLPFYMFAIAAGAAELCSGWLRLDWRVSDAVAMPLVAALLLGGFHWFVLRVWRKPRDTV